MVITMVIITLLTPHKNTRTKNYSRTDECTRKNKDVDRCKLSG